MIVENATFDLEFAPYSPQDSFGTLTPAENKGWKTHRSVFRNKEGTWAMKKAGEK